MTHPFFFSFLFFSFMIPSSSSARASSDKICNFLKKNWWFYAIWSPQGWVGGFIIGVGPRQQAWHLLIFFFLLILNRYLTGTWRVYTWGGKEIKKKLWPRLIFNPGQSPGGGGGGGGVGALGVDWGPCWAQPLLCGALIPIKPMPSSFYPTLYPCDWKPKWW